MSDVKIVTLFFEDKGQDFLEWDVNTKTLEIIGYRPFQSRVWVGQRLKKLPRVLQKPILEDGRILKYRVIKRKTIKKG